MCIPHFFARVTEAKLRQTRETVSGHKFLTVNIPSHCAESQGVGGTQYLSSTGRERRVSTKEDHEKNSKKESETEGAAGGAGREEHGREK
ncbi:hypothetical protein PV327_005685 [Microctonus hyperodae]|uniref:Uncharacterized protein n=1 Tax=Microctonus hyperodae TaxID=165561 RepID=A0AA39L030_MICHY|nr:hypothetical protein PV327_005685 [Microctonus hyperodae]